MKLPSQIFVPVIRQSEDSKINHPTKTAVNDILANFEKNSVDHLSIEDITTIFKRYWGGTITLFCRSYHLNTFLFEDMLRNNSIYLQGYRAVKMWLLREREEKFVASRHDPVFRKSSRPIGYERTEWSKLTNIHKDESGEVGIHLLDPWFDPTLPKTPIGV